MTVTTRYTVTKTHGGTTQTIVTDQPWGTASNVLLSLLNQDALLCTGEAAKECIEQARRVADLRVGDAASLLVGETTYNLAPVGFEFGVPGSEEPVDLDKLDEHNDTD